MGFFPSIIYLGLIHMLLSSGFFCHWENRHVSTMIYSVSDNNHLSVICGIINQKSVSTYVFFTKAKAHVDKNTSFTLVFDMVILTGRFFSSLSISCVSFVFYSSWDFSDGDKSLSNLSSTRISSISIYMYTLKIGRRIHNKID